MRKFDEANKFGARLLFDPTRSLIGGHVANIETLDAKRVEREVIHRRDG